MNKDRIDAHHHLWHYRAEEFDWISDDMRALRRDFLPADLEQEIRSARIDGVVAVQARQTLQETEWLLELAGEQDWIRGVVGWAPIAAREFPEHLDALRQAPRLKGLRHLIQAEPDPDFILREDFNRGISMLRDACLTYDILILEQQLPQTIRFVDLHPDQPFVLDHFAKPLIAARQLEPWAARMRDLGRREQVSCKLSGLVTEADWQHWSPADFTPYWDVVLEAFGPRRILFGSDWPVCLLGTSYTRWFAAIEELISRLSETEKRAILGENAIRIYRL